MSDDRSRRSLSFRRIAGSDHNHSRQGSHDSQVFRRMMSRAQRPVRKSAPYRNDLDVRVVIADVIAHLLEASEDRKIGDRIGKYDLSAEGHAGRYAGHVLLGHTRIDEIASETAARKSRPRRIRDLPQSGGLARRARPKRVNARKKALLILHPPIRRKPSPSRHGPVSGSAKAICSP